MPFEADTEHGDLAAYVTGRLDSTERARFERHLADCESCRAEARELAGTAVLLERVEPPFEASEGLREDVLEAVRAAAGEGSTAARVPRAGTAARRAGISWPRRAAIGLAGAAVVALGVFAGTRIADEEDLPSVITGPVEIEGTATGPGGATGDVVVRLLGTGRQVSFETGELPILPTGEYYALWFVGPGDAPAAPNRISAGTFHPDEEGKTDVQLHAAVDPTKYPVVEITAEPGDGNPEATGAVVMRLDATDLIRPGNP